MKKNIFLIVLTALLLVSCSTVVNIDTLVPAEVDIGGNAVIAVSSTTPGRYHYDYYDTDDVTYYAGKVVEKALSQGVYSVKGVRDTDAIINASKTLNMDPTEQLVKSGVDILVQSNIEDMDCYKTYSTEIHLDDHGHKNVHVYVERHARLAMSFVVWDLKKLEIIDSFSLSGKSDSDSEGAYIESYDGRITRGESGTRAIDLYEDILRSFSHKIRNRLVPHYEYTRLSLYKYDGENSNLDVAYRLVNDGELRRAFDIFSSDWRINNTTASGCNAAILQYALGECESAIAFAEEVYAKTGNPKAYDVSVNLRNLYESYNEAILQIGGKEAVPQGSVIQY